MAYLGLEYPLTHDLEKLLKTLREEGQDVDSFWALERYTDFALMLRYETLDNALSSERPEIVKNVTALVRHVDSLTSGGAPD